LSKAVRSDTACANGELSSNKKIDNDSRVRMSGGSMFVQ
jgi:hypothetical protein